MRTFAAASAAIIVAAAAVWPSAAEAQSRRFRGRGRPVVVLRGHYGSYFGPFGAFYGWSPHAFGYAPYGYAPFGHPYYARSYEEASARVQVKPKQAEVYVDGFLAGVADDFDGTFQRLHLRPGGHEITLYLEGHRPVTERIYFSPGRTQKIKAALVPLAPGEAPAPRPVPPPRRSAPRRRDATTES
jgi:hypothetical protein